ncbi:MAG: serine hydrolase [Gemmatimonadetes bacterium]|nr:serine hydrolase [Gemmatimonadota bacterium]
MRWTKARCPAARGVMRFSALTFLLLLLLAACGTSVPDAEPGAGSDEALQARIQARLDSLDAQSSAYAKHLPTGREIAVRADEPISTHSVIKIPIMVLAYRDAAAGRLDLDERYTITAADLRGGGLLRTFGPGLRPTYRDLVTQMIITSDNTATDIMLKKVGRERVNEMLEELGYRETRVLTTTGDLFRARWIMEDSAFVSLTDRQVFEMGSPQGGPNRWEKGLLFEGTHRLGVSTAREMSRLLEQIHNAALVSREASDEMIDILLGQLYSSRLPQRVRYQGVRVAHKTGDGPPYAGNDVGLLFYDGGPTIVSVFTHQHRGRDFFDLEAKIGRIAEDLVASWRALPGMASSP